MTDEHESKNIKKMLAGEPYSHDGMTEYSGLPPMSPHPNVKPGNKVDVKKVRKHQDLVRDFMRSQENEK